MKRFSVAFVALCALATAAYIPATRVAVAAAKPTPTPTPVALAYDQIDRMALAPATAPPPGSFQADYQVAMSGASSSTAAAPAATPTPAPRHRGLGGLIGGVLSGNVGGAVAEQAGENAEEDAMSHMAAGMPGMPGMDALNQLRAGRLTRYTFYYARGWVREDDPVAQTATISKCNEHVFISLDLKNKTYRQSNTQAAVCHTPAMGGGHGGGATAPEAPGTVDLTVQSKSDTLGPRTLEGVSTVGYSDSMSMKMENATGSCRNANFSMTMVEYVSQIGKPRAYCPLSRAPVAGIPGGNASPGGCQPKMHAAGNGNVMARADKLEMYVKTTFGGSEGQAGASGFASILERGNVKWLYKNQADPLFQVPAGFTQQQ